MNKARQYAQADQEILRSSTKTTSMSRSAFENWVEPYLISNSVLSVAHHWFMASLYGGEHEQPWQPRTVAGMRQMLAAEAISDLEAESTATLFAGINGRLNMPVILAPTSRDVFEPQRYARPEHMTAWPMVFCEPAMMRRLTPANLVRFCGWPLADAKRLFANLSPLGRFDLYFGKDGPDAANIQVFNRLVDRPSAIWRMPRDQFHNRLGQQFAESEVEAVLEAWYAPLPIRQIRLWRHIAEMEYGSLQQAEEQDWADLSMAAQHRHIVNACRHCSPYSELMMKCPPGKRQLAHDVLFERIAREIAATMPALKGEAMRQLEELLSGERRRRQRNLPYPIEAA